MSKAFTKEDDSSVDVLTREPPRVAAGEKRYITPEGYRSLESQLEQLLRERPDEPRIPLLRATLAVVTVQAPEPSSGRVVFGSWVTVEDEEGESKTYRLVGLDEADVKAGRLSIASPLARALINREEGDTVTVDRPRGQSEVTITRVRYSE